MLSLQNTDTVELKPYGVPYLAGVEGCLETKLSMTEALQKLKEECVAVSIRMAPVSTAINIFAGFTHPRARVYILSLLCRSQSELIPKI